LIGPKLDSANFTGANLSGTDLKRLHFGYVSFNNANLSGANLSEARFWETSLTNANLSNADFTYADFRKADLTKANLIGAKNLTVELLSEAKCLYGAHLDSNLEEPMKRVHPHLFR